MPYHPRSLGDLQATLLSAQSRYSNEMTQWKERLEKDSVDAFRWADRAVQASVRLEEIDYFLKSLIGRDSEDKRTDAEVIAFLAEHYGQKCVSTAQRIARSSSVFHNMVDDHQRAFNAALFSWFSGTGFPSL